MRMNGTHLKREQIAMTSFDSHAWLSLCVINKAIAANSFTRLLPPRSATLNVALA
jgi:hypothetical protein